ncbi:MAG: SDR family NAD(P)-dependent oxidoreductase [Desulfatitalea sp.]|nr:SDR family NAD(P)-dependent oxidoreductase [Desulfatitalea sp.]NNJ98772.1 SDR family NAD(P)-dependent oxidoreductase [Desulfatitalea sp.]
MQFFLNPVRAYEFSRIIETNVTGTFNCCKAAAESMIPRNKGKIINIGSIRGSIGVEWGMAAFFLSLIFNCFSLPQESRHRMQLDASFSIGRLR